MLRGRGMRLMSNPRDLSALPCLPASDHTALVPPRENGGCLAAASAVLSLPVPFPVDICGMRY